MQSIQARVFGIVADTANIDIEAIVPDTTLRDLGVASLDAIEMLFLIEEKFGIELNDRDVDLKNATAAMLVEAVERAMNRGANVTLATPAG
ncbi:MAG: acyl carrier protein [Pseudomonadota bacterium]